MSAGYRYKFDASSLVAVIDDIRHLSEAECARLGAQSRAAFEHGRRLFVERLERALGSLA